MHDTRIIHFDFYALSGQLIVYKYLISFLFLVLFFLMD